MNRIFKKIESVIIATEEQSISFFFWCSAFLSIIFIRILFESWIDELVNKSASYVFYNVVNTLLFFLFSYLILLGFLSNFFKTSLHKVANIMLWGYLIIILPPVIDHIIFGDSHYLNFYGIYELGEMFNRFITFFGDRPNFGVTYGTRIEILVIVVAIFIYGYIKTKKWTKALLGAFLSYVILFGLATFPSWLTILGKGFSKGFLEVAELDIIKIFIPPTRIFSREVGDAINALSIKLSLIYSLLITGILLLGFFFNYREQLIAFIKNSRVPQILYHLGLFVLGFGISFQITEVTWDADLFNILSFLNVAVAIVFAWLASVVINDIVDEKIDAITNKDRPLILGKFSKHTYAVVGIILFISSIIFSALVNPKIAMLLVAYQCLAWLYSAKPFRLKRVPILATFISALASLLVLFSGFVLIIPSGDITELPSRIIWLVAIAFTLSLPLKDLKDMEGDKQDGVWTIPVVCGEYWGKIVIGGGIFLSYILSVLFLREFDLLLSAIVCGGISFWMVILSEEGKKINHRNVIWWVMGIVFIYLLMLIGYLF